MDWIWYSQNHIANGLLANPPQFYLPFESDSVSVVTEEHERTKEMLTNHKICKSALGYLLNLKIKPWLQMKNGVANSIIHQHGLIGKTSNRQKEFNEQVKNNLDDYFLTLEMLASPTSTRFVREQTRTCLRDDDDGGKVVELPPYLSKRKLYRRFCNEQGWEVTTSASIGIDKITKQREDANYVCTSWPTFLAYWKSEYPHIVQRRPSEDICDQCFLYCNAFRHRLVQQRAAVISSTKQ